MPTNTVILTNAPIACVLAGNDVSAGTSLGKRIDPLLPQKIYATYYVIKKIYDNDPNYAGMTTACIYLWELMGKYGIKALTYTVDGGAVAPVTPPSFFQIPDFYVDATSYIITGQSVKTITTYRGYGLLFIRNNVPQSQAYSGSGESYYTWDASTTTFTCYPAAVEGELFQLIPII